jgi:hypothetical protein
MEENAPVPGPGETAPSEDAVPAPDAPGPQTEADAPGPPQESTPALPDDDQDPGQGRRHRTGRDEQNEDPVTQEQDADDETRPCAFCGRPVPQWGDSSPSVRFCLDNDGACARAAADRRLMDQDTPGLTGQVARTWDMVERLEDVAELLAMSLTGAMSVVTVERRVAEARAEAAASVAFAHKDREVARKETEQVVAMIGPVRDRAQRAEEEVARLAGQLESAVTERDTAREMGAQATRTAEAANSAIAAVREDQDRLTRQVAELTSALDAAREEAARQREELGEAKGAQKRSLAAEELRTKLRAAESELDKMRTTADLAQKSRSAAEQASAEADRQALEARSHAEEMSLEREAAISELETCQNELQTTRSELEAANARLEEHDGLTAELDASRQELEESRARLLEQQLQSREHSQMVDQLRAALAKMISERDAARADADEAIARMDELAQGHFSTMARHSRPPEQAAPSPGPFPPGHDLGSVTGPPDLFRRRFLPPSEE